MAKTNVDVNAKLNIDTSNLNAAEKFVVDYAKKVDLAMRTSERLIKNTTDTTRIERTLGLLRSMEDKFLTLKNTVSADVFKYAVKSINNGKPLTTSYLSDINSKLTEFSETPVDRLNGRIASTRVELLGLTNRYKSYLDVAKSSGYIDEDRFNKASEGASNLATNIEKVARTQTRRQPFPSVTKETSIIPGLSTEQALKELEAGLTDEQRKQLALKEEAIQKERQLESIKESNAKDFAAAFRMQYAEQQKLNAIESERKRKAQELRNIFEAGNSKLSSSYATANYNTFKSDLDAIDKKFAELNTAISAGNTSSTELVSKYRELGDLIRIIQGQAVNAPALSLGDLNSRVNGLSESYNQLGTRLNSQLSDMAQADVDVMRARLQSAVKLVADSAKSALKQTANIAKSIINTSASLLKSAFSKSLGVIKDKFTSIFSANQTSGIVSQFKNLLIGAGVVKSIKSIIDYSSGLTETINRVDYVFKDNADSIKDWAKSNVDSFGLTEGSALKFASTFGGILNASGIASDEVAGLAENLTEMTGDLSSFYDIDQDVFFKKLQSGLAGNSAALRTFGINVSATNLELYRQSQGITTAYKDMDQSSKVILRYNYIVDSAKDASGDFARTQYTWANQVRLLKQEFISLGTILGGFFVKSLLPVIQVLNQIFAFAVRAATAIAKLFGFDQESIKDLVSGVGAISDDYAGYIDDTADALGNESDALKDTGKAAKEAAENLQGFDKLNNTTTDKGSEASSKGTGVSGVGDANLSLKDWGDGINVTKEQTEFEKWLDELYSILAEREWKKAGQKVADGLNLVTMSLYGRLMKPQNREKIHEFNNAITDFYDGLLEYDTEALGRTIGAGIKLITYSINDLYETASEKDVLTETGKKIADFFTGLADEVSWYDLGKAFVTGIKASMDVLSGFLDKAEKNDLATKVGNAIKNFLNGAVSRLFKDGGAREIGSNIFGVVNFALKSFATAFGKDEDGNGVVDDIANSILTVINTAIRGIDKNDLADALTALLGVIGTLFGMLGNIDTDTLSDKISYAINTAADNGSLSDAVNGIASAILNVFNLLGKTFEKIDWSSVATAIWKGLQTALESNDGGQYILSVFATLFGVKLLGQVGSWGLHAVGSKIISSIAGFISGSTAIQQVSGAFSVLLKPSNLGIAGLALALGVMYVDGIKDVVHDRLGNNFFDDKTINKVKSQLSGTLTFTVDPSVYKNLTSYRDKLKELATTYDNVAQLVDDPSFGKDTAASIRDLTAYMNELKKAGAGGSTAFKNLEDAIDSYNNAGIFDKSSEMDAVKAAAQSLQTEFDITVDTIDSLNDVQFNALDENFSKLKQNTSFSADEVNELTLTWSNAGKQLSEGLLDKTKETLDTDTSVDLSTSNLITGATSDENTGAKVKGIGVGTSLTAGVSSTLSADTSIKTNTSSLVTNATLDSNTGATTKGAGVGKDISSGVAKGADDNHSIVNKALQDLSDLIKNEKELNFKGKAESVGILVLDGLQVGLENREKRGGLSGVMAGIANSLINTVRDILDIHSPSRVFAKLATFIPAGIGVGIKENASSAYTAVSNICSGLTDEFENNNINTNALISDEKFDTVYASLMKQTDMAVGYVANKLDTLRDMLNMQSSFTVNPSVGKANLQAAYASEASSTGVVNSLGSIYSKLATGNLGGSNKPVQVNVYLDQNNKLSSFIINTVNGNITKTGNF